MPDAADGFELPDDPREILMLLDTLRIRALGLTETLEITDDEIGMLRADSAALTEAVRATEAAAALAQEWRRFQSRLLRGPEGVVTLPETIGMPPFMGVERRSVVRETALARTPPMRAGIETRLQRFVNRLLAHPNATDQTRLELGLLPGAMIGFSSGQRREAETTD